MIRFLLALALIAGSAPARADFVLQQIFPNAPASPITPALVPNTSSGVAPLAVVFDLTGTTTSEGTISYPELQMSFSCDFADSGSGTWSRGSRAGISSKNAGTGPVQAHVYETAGTYNVVCTYYDGVNTTTKGTTIVVSSADSTYAGTATICFAIAEDPVPGVDGCPSGAAHHQIASGDFDDTLLTYAADNTRLLFKHDETGWQTSSQAIIAKNGLFIGTYGSGAAIKVTRTGGTTILRIGTSGQSYSGLVIQDIELTGSAACVSADAGGTFDNATFLRVNCHDATYGFNFPFTTPSLQTIHDGLAIVDSIAKTIAGAAGNGMFLTMKRAAIMGNLIDDTTGAEHNFRCMYCYKTAIANNTFQNPASTKGNIVLRAPPWLDTTTPQSGGTGYQVGDVLTVVGGTGTAAQLTVTTVTASGAITTTGTTVSNPGNYSVLPAPVAPHAGIPNSVTGGHGTGATFVLTQSGTTVSAGRSGYLFDESGGYSSYINVADNKLVGGTGMAQSITTSIDQNFIAYTRYILAERNWIQGPFATGTLQGVSINSDYTMWRNNLVDMSNTTSNGVNAIQVSNNGATCPGSYCMHDPGTDGPNIMLNNSIYSSASPTNFRGVLLQAASINSQVINNLVYAPSATTTSVLTDSSAGGTTATTNTSNGKTNPNFTTTPPATADCTTPASTFDWKPTSGYAVDGGTATAGLFDDFCRTTRSGTTDIGAAVAN